MSNTVNNNIPFVPENTIDPAAGLNEALNVIDILLQLAVVTVNTNTPPASPAEGDRHVVGQAPTGAWAGRAGLVARYLDGYWNFLPARLAFNLADGVLYGRRTTTWVSVAGSGGVAWGSITGTLSAQTDLANALAAKVSATQLGANNGVATLDAAGKIPTSQLPPLAVNEVFTVASQAAMLGLSAERGDVAIRTDQAGRAYILSADAPGTLANWISLDQALSVALAALNALTPAVDRLPYFDSTSTAALAVFTAQARTLLAAATQAAQKVVLGLDQVSNTSDASKPVSTPQQAALDLKAPINNPSFTGGVGVGGPVSALYMMHVTGSPASMTGNQYGVRSECIFQNSGYATAFGAAVRWPDKTDALTIALAANYTSIAPTLGANITLTEFDGFRIDSITNTAITLVAAVRLNQNVQSGYDRFNIYCAGTAPNYMNGDVRIGTTVQDGSAKLTVAGGGSFAGSVKVQDGSGTGSMVIGADVNANTLSNGTRKLARLAVPPRALANPNWIMLAGDTTANDGVNEVYVGGAPGSSIGGATSVQIYTSSDQLAGTGTLKWRIDAAGHLQPGAANSYDVGTVTAPVRAVVANTLNASGAAVIGGPALLGRYTLTTLPSASTYQNYLIIVTNATGGAKVCWSNGTNWCLLNTSTVVS